MRIHVSLSFAFILGIARGCWAQTSAITQVKAPSGVVTGHILCADTRRPGRFAEVALLRQQNRPAQSTAPAPVQSIPLVVRDSSGNPVPGLHVSPSSSDITFPPSVQDAFESSKELPGAPLILDGWIFPNHRSAYALVMRGTISSSSALTAYAQLRNETIGLVVGRWRGGFRPELGRRGRLFWERRTTALPGVYVLQVAALSGGNVVSSKSYKFFVHNYEYQAVPTSSLILSTTCTLSPDENEVRRRILPDPLSWNGCQLVPTTQVTETDHLRFLLRMYPRDAKIAKELMTRWNPHLVIDGKTDTRTSSLGFHVESDGNLVIYTNIDNVGERLGSGPHSVQIILTGPRGVQLTMAQSQFAIVAN